jgi:site-specific DNA recombinase
MTEIKRRIRCAVYTRKSTDEGLDMEFNSLDAQREAGEAYIASQRSEGWTIVPDYYDDGGVSGGHMDRPALKRMLKDIENGLIDVVVVYKVDRLSRSLADFAKLVELFDKHKVSFVSVTQQFNTTTSMGRLTLNILLSFAQFEREVIGERIRDKFAASKRKGMWMGGYPPLGYDVVERKLLINETEAVIVRQIFERFLTVQSATALSRELRAQGIRTKALTTKKGNQRNGGLMSKSYLYKLLKNPVYVGDISHKGKVFTGQHQGIISRETWDKVRGLMEESPRVRNVSECRQTPALLKGFAACGGCQSIMSPTATRKKGKQYRYYAGSKYLTLKCTDCPIGRVPAAELEQIVVQRIKPLLQTPETIVQAWLAAREHDPAITEHEVREALQNLDQVWDQLFPAEQRRILELVLDRVTVNADKVDIRVKTEGLACMTRELITNKQREEMAA